VQNDIDKVNNDLKETRKTISDSTPIISSAEKSSPVPNATISSSPTVLQHPQITIPTSPTNPIDLTTIFESTSQVKPIFPQYSKKITISKWQVTCILKLTACKNKYYQSFVIQNSSGKNMINLDLSRNKVSV